MDSAVHDGPLNTEKSVEQSHDRPTEFRSRLTFGGGWGGSGGVGGGLSTSTKTALLEYSKG